MDYLAAKSSVSITDLKKNPSAVIKEAEGSPVVILNHNKPSAYIVPADAFEAMLEKLDDLEIKKTVRKRQSEKSIPVSLDAL
ncbi:MAG: type II toxin-antitoxin system prevent-host-death family antitoxin [Smithellaceae bacterium]|nr:type II toxin-antitoxin system prevent-host-death family antitoxin [Smithellaceae bacterium]